MIIWFSGENNTIKPKVDPVKHTTKTVDVPESSTTVPVTGKLT